MAFSQRLLSAGFSLIRIFSSFRTYPIDPEITIFRNLKEWDRKYIWHPFTQMREYMKTKPFVIERGEGSYLIDIEGNRYLDGVSSLWVTVHGHNKKEINEAIKEQVEQIAHSTLLLPWENKTPRYIRGVF